MKTPAEEYLRRLEEIQASGETEIGVLPQDERRFVIDTNSRMIYAPEEFTYLALLNDHNAETYYFEIDRYFDSVDLANYHAVIQFCTEAVDKCGCPLVSDVYPVGRFDVESVPGKIIFGWTIENNVTTVATNIHFSVRFYELEGDKFVYNFNTLPIYMPVIDTLNLDKLTMADVDATGLYGMIKRTQELEEKLNELAKWTIPAGGENGQLLGVNEDGKFVWTNPILNHNDMSGREETDAHPIAAITGLAEALEPDEAVIRDTVVSVLQDSGLVDLLTDGDGAVVTGEGGNAAYYSM